MAENFDEFGLIGAVAEKDDFGLGVGAAQLGYHRIVRFADGREIDQCDCRFFIIYLGKNVGDVADAGDHLDVFMPG